MIHIVHVVLAGIMEDMELRIHAEHLLQTVLHGEDASDHYRTSCLNIGLASKDLRKSFHHSLGYPLVLNCSERSQLAVASSCLLAKQFHLCQCLFALGSELALLLRLQQSKVRQS